MTISSWPERTFTGAGLLACVGSGPEPYILYILGLATVGLLWGRGDWRHRVIPGLLALIWVRIALGAYLAPAGEQEAFVPGGVEALAIGEVLLLLVEGVFRGTLRFAGRRGPWPFLGGALLFYALAIHPLLGAVVPGGLFGTFFFGMPIPPLAFTLGLLFFLRNVTPSRRVLTIPLLWAAMGGSAPLLGTIHLWALRVVFVGGCAFAFLPEVMWKGHWRVDHRIFYEFALRTQWRLNTFLVTLLTGSLGYLFLWENGIAFEGWFVRFSISLGLLGISAFTYWLVFPAWLTPWFRSLTWAVARGTGTLWKVFRSALRWVALLVVAVLGIDAVGHRVTGTSTPLVPPQLTPPRQAQLVAGMLLLWLIYLAYLGRKRLVIQPFVDHTRMDEVNQGEGKDGLNDRRTLAGSVDSDLRNALVRISDLYRVIDEALPAVKRNVVDVTADVKDVGDILKEAAGSGSAFKLLGAEIPANFIFSLLGRLVRGPRLTGSVNGGERGVFLVAELSGGGMHGNWRVDCSHLEKEDSHLSGEPAIRKLTEQLAYRIATSLVSVGSPRWRAVRCFTEGLRHYRETQRTNKDCGRNLRLAEKCLLDAANDDDCFAPCHYNLGVVYRRLGEHGSAKSAFRSAIRVDPGYYAACYALAETHSDEGEFEEALWVCDSAIGIAPQDGRAWDLKAYALRQFEQARKGKKLSLRKKDPTWKGILSLRQISVALSWRALCRAACAASSSALEEQRGSTRLCTRNLAVVLGRIDQLTASELIFRQAARLVPHDPDLHVSLGKALYWSARWGEAERVLQEIFDDGLDLGDRTTLWSILVRVRTQTGSPEDPRKALDRLLDLVATVGEDEDSETLIDILNDTLEFPEKRHFRVRDERSEIPAVRRAYKFSAAHGLGVDGTGAGSIRLVIRLYGFLQTLETEAGRFPREGNSLEALQFALQPELRRERQQEVFVRRLVGLGILLRRLLGANRLDDTSPEASVDHLARKVRDLNALLVPIPGDGEDEARRTLFCRALQDLGFLRRGWTVGRRVDGVGSAFKGLLTLRDAVAGAPTTQTRKLLAEGLRDARLSLEWAYCQVLVRLSREYLEVRASHPQRYKRARSASAHLKSAIRRLEARSSLQPQEQGLYGLLAQAHIVSSEEPALKEPVRLNLRRQAFACSERAAELEPESARERLALVRVYSALGDYAQAEDEAAIAVNLDAGAKALRVVGSSFWTQATSAGTRRTRRAVLREAVEFFSRTLHLIESQAFDTVHPLDQMQSHAWAHHWLGRFHCELMEHEKGIGHEEVAKAMGFKPLESRVNLANAYLETGSYAKAEAAFRDAREAASRLAPGHAMAEVLDSPGEERPLGELLIELCVGWALLNAERGLTPESSSRLAAETESLVSKIIAGMEPEGQSPLQAALHEGLACLHLRAGQRSESLYRAALSLRFGFRSGAYLCLARAHLMGEAPSPAEVRQAREALRHAKDLDLRGRYRREILQARSEIRRLEETVH